MDPCRGKCMSYINSCSYSGSTKTPIFKLDHTKSLTQSWTSVIWDVFVRPRFLSTKSINRLIERPLYLGGFKKTLAAITY